MGKSVGVGYGVEVSGALYMSSLLPEFSAVAGVLVSSGGDGMGRFE